MRFISYAIRVPICAAILFVMTFAGCSPSLRTSGLFVHNSSFRRLLKNQNDYVRLLREAVLVLKGDTSGLKFDSIYGQARLWWINAALNADSNTPAPVQTIWAQHARTPSVSTGSASWIIAASMLGISAIGSVKLTYPLVKNAENVQAIILLEYPHEYQWISGIKVSAAQAQITRSDCRKMRIFADGRHNPFADSLRQCIVLVKNDSLICPFINAAQQSRGASGATLFSYARYLRTYGAFVSGKGSGISIPALMGDTLPCEQLDMRRIPE